jgi:phosphatidate cytidylyltransferase
MALPPGSLQRMVLLVWGVLLAAAVPLAIFSPVLRRRGQAVKTLWIKYAAWFVIVPLVTVPMILGGVWVQVALLVVSLYALEEYARLVGLGAERVHLWLARLGIVAVYVPAFLARYDLFLAVPPYLALPIILVPILQDRSEGMTRVTALTFLGVIYFGWFPAHLALLAGTGTGRAAVLALLVLITVNDTAAHLVGASFGHRPLAPRLSPNKTVEGFLGAAAVTVLMTFAVRFALGGLSAAQTVLLGLVLAVAGTCGDLAISMIKRDVHVKDTGRLIPGHGGLLDRLDSTLIAAPIFFYFMRTFGYGAPA